MEEKKKQYALVNKEGEIQVIILTRDTEFYCYERLDDSPRSFKEAEKMYPECQRVELRLSARTQGDQEMVTAARATKETCSLNKGT